MAAAVHIANIDLLPAGVNRAANASTVPDDAASVAAFIFEPVVGATLGAAVPPDSYAQRIAEICRKRGILLIADEIMSGMGRTGKPFAIQHWNVEPDIILVGKGIAKEIIFTGEMVMAERAYEIGLVNKIVDPSEVLKEAKALLDELDVASTSCVLRDAPLGRSSA